MDMHMLTGFNENDNSEKKRIGIIAALEVEVYTLKQNLKSVKVTRTAGTDYYIGIIGDYEVILMQCGMGKVSAASGAQALITEFHPDYVINTGCAGALAGDLGIGDIVLSTVTVEWDLDTIAIGNPRGYVSAMDAVEMHADEKLLGMIASAIPENVTVWKGMVCSGDQFVSTDEQRYIILCKVVSS
jgi:adenosylhomocysteine nucleosidase